MDHGDIQKKNAFIFIDYVIEMVINTCIYLKKIQLKFNRSKLMLTYW